ncbi:Leucine-, isoleucine-, valine-, threonine-, and alanine-binding protein [Rhodoplanes serenus]|uniref:Leucine-, isoleucine-, valine-, threonine-, and alanine-binding protein n=1 Tax=Rhodoplanes serenus TaxID=200615 RepID=A0A447D143_9BRAD|nr:ABC transporter substrate-binding protein [Rhodoplanes serenus]MBI5113898.1 amino acid ABC transporter substrate-binding protein [Rhodovulum sp.]VCU11239.1 Leucine-, isoleucine-, valine-, threonine-, and alanine-binding protein [Rhodoplanes serenus]
MKRLWGLLALSALCSVLATSPAPAQTSGPSKVKVGILLPLTGPFAAVAETQKQGALLAVDVINKKGGLDMPWGKVQVEGMVDDDEAKLDVGVRRYRYMMSEGVKGVGGQTWAPLSYAINAIVSREPMAYFPVCVMAKEAFQKGKIAPSTFAAAYSPWTVGYTAGTQAVKTLGKKKIFFLARSDSWGWDIRDGVYAAAKEHGAEIVGYDEASLGTSDFTTILQKVRAAKPDVFIAAQFAADSVALLKQAHQMGLNKDMTIFNAFITNVVAKGLPPEALQGVYAMHYFYYDLSALGDSGVAEKAAAFTKLFQDKYGYPPDAYAAIAYIAYMEMFRGFEQSKSFDAAKVAAALKADGGKFDSVKGPGSWREDNQAAFKYGAFLVKGKGPADRKGDWDLFTVEGSMGGDQILPPLKSLGY